jgi:hypothetical protein
LAGIFLLSHDLLFIPTGIMSVTKLTGWEIFTVGICWEHGGLFLMNRSHGVFALHLWLIYTGAAFTALVHSGVCVVWDVALVLYLPKSAIEIRCRSNAYSLLIICL